MVFKSGVYAMLALSLTEFGWGDVQGFDISNWQPTVDFEAAYTSGARFVIIKATEGTGFIDKVFSQHYKGATAAGLVRGGYHFARPGESTPEAQADFFLAHGGGWTGDGITLPGMLDLEASNSAGGACWGLTAAQMVAWIGGFSDRYRDRTGRYPMIYTNPGWWGSCTGGSTVFKDTNPLVLARWAAKPEPVIGGWAKQTIWQYDDHYQFGGDSDLFNGSEDDLRAFATG